MTKKNADLELFRSCGRALTAMQDRRAKLSAEISKLDIAIRGVVVERDEVEAALKMSRRKRNK